MRLKIETGLTVIIMAVIFTLACTGECSPSMYNEMKAHKSKIAGAYNKVGLASKYINHDMGILRFLP